MRNPPSPTPRQTLRMLPPQRVAHDNLKPLEQCPAHAARGIPLHNAQELTGDGTTAHIELDGQIYTLRITRAGKLILTK